MKRNAYTPDEKAKMVLEALRGERTINVPPNMLSRWKREAEGSLFRLFQDDSV